MIMKEAPFRAITERGFLSCTCGAKGNRTPDLLDANETRYQLRYSPSATLAGRGCHPHEQRGTPYQDARSAFQTGSAPAAITSASKLCRSHSPAVWVCIRMPSSLKMLITCAGRAPAAERLCGTRVSNSAASPRTRMSS